MYKKSRIVVMFAFAESVFGLCSAAPGLADTIRATPVTSWKSLSVTGGSAKASGKTQGHKKAYMSSDGVWHSQANYIFTVAGHKKTDRDGYGKIDASVFYYTCQPMPGGNCIPKVLRTGASGSTGRLVGGKAYRWDADAKIRVGRNQRGGWQRSSKICIDLVARRDKCSDGLNW